MVSKQEYHEHNNKYLQKNNQTKIQTKIGASWQASLQELWLTHHPPDEKEPVMHWRSWSDK